MGFEKALDVMEKAYEKSRGIQLNRLGKLFGFKLDEGIPEPLLNMPEEKLTELVETLV